MTWTFSAIPDTTGWNVVITGANSGIGFHSVRHLVRSGATVVLACRNKERAEKARAELIQEFPGSEPRVIVILLDLADFASVKAFRKGFEATGLKHIDVLLNNAGVMFPPYTKTKDGHELMFQANHLGHFMLTGELLPLLEKARNPRVVNVSSNAHKFGRSSGTTSIVTIRKTTPVRATTAKARAPTCSSRAA